MKFVLQIKNKQYNFLRENFFIVSKIQVIIEISSIIILLWTQLAHKLFDVK